MSRDAMTGGYIPPSHVVPPVATFRYCRAGNRKCNLTDITDDGEVVCAVQNVPIDLLGTGECPFFVESEMDVMSNMLKEIDRMVSR